MAEGKSVKREYDGQEREQYGRLLAYVYLMDGAFHNAEIAKQGYGHAYTVSFKCLDGFRQYEMEAWCFTDTLFL